MTDQVPFILTVRDRDGVPMELAALRVAPGLAVHAAAVGRSPTEGWTISSEAHGLALVWNLPTQGAAIDCARDMARAFDWSTLPVPDATVAPGRLAPLMAAYQAMKALARQYGGDTGERAQLDAALHRRRN